MDEDQEQGEAEVVPLFGERRPRVEEPGVTVEWRPADDHDPGAYRRLLELLFLPRDQQQRDKAA